MQTEVLTFHGPRARREVLATAPTFEDALELVRERWDVLVLELDGSFPGCADAFTTAGDVLAIQPVGFQL